MTKREEDVLAWVVQGKTNADTARIIRISPGTVKVHRERICRKLGVENPTAAAALVNEKNGRTGGEGTSEDSGAV